MFSYTAILAIHDQRATELRAEAARYRLARQAQQAPAHRRRGRWSRLIGRDPGATRAPVHP